MASVAVPSSHPQKAMCPCAQPLTLPRHAVYVLQMNHAKFIEHIIACAHARQARKAAKKVTEVQYKHGIGYGLYAARDIQQGLSRIPYGLLLWALRLDCMPLAAACVLLFGYPARNTPLSAASFVPLSE